MGKSKIYILLKSNYNMAWKLSPAQAKALQREPFLGTLEQLCERIKNEILDKGESKGKVFARDIGDGFYRTYAFVGTSFVEHCNGDSKENILQVGISNLRFLFPEPKYGVDAENNNVKIYEKPSDQLGAQI